ncbi:MAG TPA: glycosyltransferase family 2 protein [Vicinamibacteria bacterium]|nr:glycosyltransferase family 2 protein [Vicinamibacteria bacterium]
MRTIITMPAYKAARTLEKTYREIPPGSFDQVLVVDDASPDDTVAVAHSLGLPVRRHDVNRGYGGNQKTCYDWALSEGADVVVLLHPDYQYAPHRVPALVEPIRAGRCDFAFGSRFKDGGDPRAGGMPLYRFLGNKLTTGLENHFLGTNFSELHSGMKAYSRRFLELIGYRGFSDKFVFDSEMVIQAVLLGFRIEEVAIPTRYADDSSSVDIASSFRYIWETLGALHRGLRDRDRLRQERLERENALGL